MDLAASVQHVTEEVMLRMTRDLARTYKIPNLCLAGGVALNCVANGKLLRDRKFKRIWLLTAVMPAVLWERLTPHMPCTQSSAFTRTGTSTVCKALILVPHSAKKISSSGLLRPARASRP